MMIRVSTYYWIMLGVCPWPQHGVTRVFHLYHNGIHGLWNLLTRRKGAMHIRLYLTIPFNRAIYLWL